MPDLHIHAPAPIAERIVVIDCPTCERPRRAFSLYFEWYGASLTCAGCGERWEDGGRGERPFQRSWRDESRRWAIRNIERIGGKA